MNKFRLSILSLFFLTSCYKTRSCKCTYHYIASGITEEKNSALSGKMTKNKARAECNKLDGNYTMGSNLEEVKVDCNLLD